jgi:hypothetical protein
VKTEKQLLQDAFSKLGSQIISDLGSLPKSLRKKAHKARIQALQNNQFRKGKK